MKVKTPPIVVSGSIAVDRIMNFGGRYKDHIQPNQLDSLSISLFMDSLIESYGGVGANIAYTLSLLNNEPVLLGSVGTEAQAYLNKLAGHGVNIAHVHKSKLPTASFHVITDSQQNQVGGFYPGAMFDSEQLSLLPWKDAEPIIVVSPHDPQAMDRQVKQCRDWQLRLCYDIGQQVSNLPGEQMAAGIDAAHILIVNDYEMDVLSRKTGKSIDAIKSTVPIVITTLGKDGSVIEGKQVAAPLRIGTAKPKRVIDPTGAGDAFRAGFLHGYSRSWPLRTCGQLGAVCAAYAIENAGTQEHYFTLKDVANRYSSTFDEALPAGTYTAYEHGTIYN